MDLLPCQGCRRHHREALCPFCGAKKAIAAVVLAASLMGCPPPAPPPPPQIVLYGAPPQRDISPRTSASIAAESSDKK